MNLCRHRETVSIRVEGFCPHPTTARLWRPAVTGRRRSSSRKSKTAPDLRMTARKREQTQAARRRRRLRQTVTRAVQLNTSRLRRVRQARDGGLVPPLAPKRHIRVLQRSSRRHRQLESLKVTLPRRFLLTVRVRQETKEEGTSLGHPRGRRGARPEAQLKSERTRGRKAARVRTRGTLVREAPGTSRSPSRHVLHTLQARQKHRLKDALNSPKRSKGMSMQQQREFELVALNPAQRRALVTAKRLRVTA